MYKDEKYFLYIYGNEKQNNFFYFKTIMNVHKRETVK